MRSWNIVSDQMIYGAFDRECTHHVSTVNQLFDMYDADGLWKLKNWKDVLKD